MVPLVEKLEAFDCLLLGSTVLVPLLGNHILSEWEIDTGASVEVGMRTSQVLVLVLLVRLMVAEVVEDVLKVVNRDDTETLILLIVVESVGQIAEHISRKRGWRVQTGRIKSRYVLHDIDSGLPLVRSAGACHRSTSTR